MAEAAIYVSPSLMRERSVLWRLVASTVSPGLTMANTSPLVRMDGGGQWAADWSDVNLRTREQVQCWRATAGLAEAGVVPLILPMCDRRYMPAPVENGVRVTSYGSIPHSDGSLFSDGSGYSQPVVIASVVGDLALRATSMTIQLDYGSAFIGGEFFTIDHMAATGQGRGPRLYMIKSVLDNEDDTYTVSISPTLRMAVADGTELDFDWPRCTVRLARTDAMDMPLDLRQTGRASPSFIEYFYPA